MSHLLEVKNYSVSFHIYGGEVQAVRDVSFTINEGERLAIVGESGSGKSVMTQSIVQLLPSPPAQIKGGQVLFAGEDITSYTFKQLRRIKGVDIAYIFQDPMTSLNPTMKIGNQLVEGIRAHRKIAREQANLEAIRLLHDAGIFAPEKRMQQYPYELSGGMRQRVMIAMAIAMKPRLLIADEPTTALDVTIQAQILQTLKKLNEEMHMALIMITHNMGIVASMAQRVAVMYGGRIVEIGPVLSIFEEAKHPYTKCLLASVPKLNEDTKRPLAYIAGSPPDMLNPPPGCPFAPRCQYSMQVCFSALPNQTQCTPGHTVSCWLHHPGSGAQYEAFIAERMV